MSFCDDVREPADPRPTTLGDFTRALAAVEAVLRQNEPQHRGAWRHEPPYSHAAHCRAHCEIWQAERRLEDLAHAAVRVLMALELALREGTA